MFCWFYLQANVRDSQIESDFWSADVINWKYMGKSLDIASAMITLNTSKSRPVCFNVQKNCLQVLLISD